MSAAAVGDIVLAAAELVLAAAVGGIALAAAEPVVAAAVAGTDVPGSEDHFQLCPSAEPGTAAPVDCSDKLPLNIDQESVQLPGSAHIPEAVARIPFESVETRTQNGLHQGFPYLLTALLSTQN